MPALVLGLCLAAPAYGQDGGADAPAPAAAEAPAVAPATFFISAIDVVGVTRLSAAEVEKIIYPFLGPDRDSATVEAARTAVQDAYAARGYETVVVDIPPQPEAAFAMGLVQLNVTEVPVGTVKVSGAKYHSGEAVLRSLPSLKSGEPLNFKALQDELAAANRFPDRAVTPSFTPGETPGTLDVDVKVDGEEPIHASLELNNDNSPNTTDLRASGSVRYTNLWGAGHTASVSFVTAPRNREESKVFSFSYTAPLAGSPITLSAFGYVSNSNIAALGGSNVLGDGYQISGRVIYRLPSEGSFQSLTAGIDYKDFKEDIVFGGATVGQAPIRYMPLNLGYSYQRSGEKTSFDLSLGTTLGLRIMKRVGCFDPTGAACPQDQFTNKGADASENFAHINLDATYTRALQEGWNAQLRITGQYADSHLVSNEQFSLGGMSTVRGYYQSEVVGDKGIAGSLELRLPSLATYIAPFVDELRGFVFVDGGLVRVIDPLPDEVTGYEVASVGGGVRLGLFKYLSGEFVVGVPIIAGPDTRRGEPRYTFVVKGEF